MAAQNHFAVSYSNDWPLQRSLAEKVEKQSEIYNRKSGGSNIDDKDQTEDATAEDIKLEQFPPKDAPTIPTPIFTFQGPICSIERESYDREPFSRILTSSGINSQQRQSRRAENVKPKSTIPLIATSPVAENVGHISASVVESTESKRSKPSEQNLKAVVPDHSPRVSKFRSYSHFPLSAFTNTSAAAGTRHTVNFPKSPLYGTTNHNSNASPQGSGFNSSTCRLSNPDSQPRKARPVSQFVTEIRHRQDIVGRRVNPKLARLRGMAYDSTFAGARDFGNKVAYQYFPELEIPQTQNTEWLE